MTRDGRTPAGGAGSSLARSRAARRSGSRWLVGLLALALLLIGLGWWLDVPQEPDAEDRAALAEMLRRAGYPELAAFPHPEGFEAEVETVLAVQDAVLSAAPIDRGIPEGSGREPPRLLELGYGLCYDRSRAIEKALFLFGLETRHASLYGTAEQGALEALVTPGADSHALSEVLTERGWMTVDSNARWLGLDGQGRPLALGEIDPEVAATVPPAYVRQAPTRLIVRPRIVIYGLYSRHGGFYPPFLPFPDVDFGQLLKYGVF